MSHNYKKLLPVQLLPWTAYPSNASPNEIFTMVASQLPQGYELELYSLEQYVHDRYARAPRRIGQPLPNTKTTPAPAAPRAMGNAFPNCNLHERTVFWPVEHVVEFQGSENRMRARAKLNTREHCDSAKLRDYLVAQFGLVNPSSSYTLYYAKLPLTQPDATLFQILPANSVVDLILESAVSFVLKE
jgi:hypothetical protein